MGRIAAFLVASLAIVTFSAVGWASVTTWTSTTGDWTVPANWDTGAPTASQDTRITNGGTVTIGVGDAAAAGSLNIGLDSNLDDVGNGINVGNLVVSGGTLSVGVFIIGDGNYLYNGIGTVTLNGGTITTTSGNNIRLGAFGGTGTITQNGGILGSQDFTWNISPFTSAATAYYMGQEGGTGTYNLNAGTLNSPWTSLGYGGQANWTGPGEYRNGPVTINGTSPGWGYFNQSSGSTHNTGELTVGGGWDSGGFGTYTMTGGNLNATNIELGELDGSNTGSMYQALSTPGWTSMISPVGVFNQNGGIVTVTTSLVVGSDLCNFGGYGGQGKGYYYLNGGTLTQSAPGASMIVRNGNPEWTHTTVGNYGNGAYGIFQGKGTVGFTGALTNNGIIAANGGTLDLSSFTSVTSTSTDNDVVVTSNIGGTPGEWVMANQSNGWYATNGGKLILPTIHVAAGAGKYTWGGAAGNNLENSLTVTAPAGTTAGSLNVSLLDAANAGVPTISGIGIGVWNVWDVASTSTYPGGFNLSLNAPCPYGGQANLSLYYNNGTGGAWTPVAITTTGDLTASHNTQITASGLQPGYYAVGTTTRTFWKGGTSGNWTSGNWDNGTPATGVTSAVVLGGATVTINSDVTSNTVMLGGGMGGSGNIVMTGGSLTQAAGSHLEIGYGGELYTGGVTTGSGSFTINAGTINLGDGGEFQVGAFGGVGTFTINGGLVSWPNAMTATANWDNSNDSCYIGAYATGTVNLHAGTLNSQAMEIGVGPNPNWGWTGDATSVGYFNQDGGTHNTQYLDIGGGYLGAGTGTYNLSGTGVLNVKQVGLGHTPGIGSSSADESGIIEIGVSDAAGIASPVGTFNQSGGTVTVDWGVIIGSDQTNAGVGASWPAPGSAGTGTGAQGIGTYNFTGGTLQDNHSGVGYGANLYVRFDAPATGTFQGHGTVAFTGTLTNNGRVIANGGTLNMSSFSSVTGTVANVKNPTDGGLLVSGAPVTAGGYLNGDYSYVNATLYTIGQNQDGAPVYLSSDGTNWYISQTVGGLSSGNGYEKVGGGPQGSYMPEGGCAGNPTVGAISYATTNGWFATNGGKLMLPPVVATTAAPSVNWGENPTAATLTLVNSAKVTVHGLVGSASFAISLDDPANAEVPNHSGLFNVADVWNVGVTPSGSFTSWDLALRYDDVAAGSAENSLGLFESTGGAWIRVPDTLDTVDHIITAAGLSLPTGAFFTVGTTLPGDANIDGAVNSLDIDAIYQHLTVAPSGYIGTWPRPLVAYNSQYDVNGDGVVNQLDVTYELNHYFHTSYGDSNLDKATDFGDFQTLLNHWQASGAAIGWAQADFNGDGVVDFLDFQILLNYWNPGGWNYAPSQTPEPASLTLILLGGLALLRRSRKA
jgi:hypothetical protein